MAILVYLRWPPAAILDFRKLKILPLDRLPRQPYDRTIDIMSISYVEPELCHFEFLDKMAAGRHVGFIDIVIIDIVMHCRSSLMYTGHYNIHDYDYDYDSVQPEAAPFDPPTRKTYGTS